MSKFHGREDSILYGSCFDANAGLFEALLTPEDAVFSDALNHASIIDGIRLCKAQKHRYPHRDLNGMCNNNYFFMIFKITENLIDSHKASFYRAIM